ncbi:MAG: hypothetical protein JSW41_03400 [Candidatus Aenigmatarchaeota archaeon]|nr:MAG: hypothetical protein JSW41_03400 [Candidatus Aenigmarchaeota archaeon]
MRKELIVLLLLMISLVGYGQQYIKTVTGPCDTEMKIKVDGPIDLEMKPDGLGFVISVNKDLIKQGYRVIQPWREYMNYYGSWAVPEIDNAGCKCAFSKVANDSLTLHFSKATEIELWGENMPHHGVFELYLNNEHQGTFDTYSAQQRDTVRHWSITGLDPTVTYVLKLIVTGLKNPNSSDSYVVFRHVVIRNIPKTIIDCPECPPGGAPVVFEVIRQGRYQVLLDGVAMEGEHNVVEKAIERAMAVKAQYPAKSVTILPPQHRIE